MTGLVRRATLITAVGLLAASAAMAGVPSASMSNGPGLQGATAVIKIVGVGSPPDANGNVTYTIRDAANNPVPGSVVILNFSACGDIRVCTSDVAAGLTVNCGAQTVSGVTNGAGQLTVAVAGAGTGAGAPTLTPTRCVTVTADGVPLANLGAATADYNGTSGVNALDLGIFASDLSATNRARSDYNVSGAVDALDLGQFAAILVGGGSPNSCSTLCP